jgi:hypothetical protein
MEFSAIMEGAARRDGLGAINILAIMCDVTTRLWRVKRPAIDGWL